MLKIYKINKKISNMAEKISLKKELSKKVFTFLLDNRSFLSNSPNPNTSDFNRLIDFFSAGISANITLEELLQKDPNVFIKESLGLGKKSVEFLQFLFNLYLFPILKIKNKNIKALDYFFMSKLKI